MKKIIAIFILLLAIVTRVYDFQGNPPGLYVDEAAIGYNAYSIQQTGKDEYNERYPLFLRSFATYSSALYTYLTIIPVKVFGLTVFATRFVSLMSGLAFVYITLRYLGLTTGLVVAVSPVFIFFSRGAFEANLALTILVSGILLAVKASKNSKLLPFAFFLLSISAYAYHAERFLSLVFITYFSWIYWQKKNRAIVLTSIVVAIFIQLPLLVLSLHSGANVRILGLVPEGTLIDKSVSFIRQYLNYYSPNNLFSKTDPDIQRSFPELSVYYWWMVFPFVYGVWQLVKKRKNLSLMEKTLIFLTLVSPIPGALTRDYFSTLRVLPMFLGIAWIISLGFRYLIGNKKLLYFPIVALALFELYSNLILLKHERSSVWGWEYKELASFVENTQGSILIDNSRQKPIYILLAFYNKYDPGVLQSQTDEKTRLDYYGSTQFTNDKILKNIEIRPLNWEKDVYKEQLIVADTLAISEKQATEHKLELVKTIPDVNGKTSLKVYKTNPEEKRTRELEN